MVNDLLLVIVLLFQTQINTSYVSFEEKYVNFSDNMTFSVSMKDSQNHVILDDSDDILVGNMEVNNETIEYSSVIKIPLSGYSNLNINSAYLTLYKKSGYGTTINVKTTNNFELGVTNPFSNFFYINSNNIELTGNYFTINLKEEISNYSSSSDYLYVVFSKASSIGSGVTVFGDSSDGYFAKFAVNTSTFPTISGVGAALPFQPINGISYNGDNTYFCECLNYSIGNYHEIESARLLRNYNVSNFSNEILNTIISRRIINYLQAKEGIKVRRLDYYDSNIYPFEYRIAYRVNTETISGHFIRQTDTGQWAGRDGTRNAELYSTSWVPENEMWDNGYNSDVLYFAIWRTHDYE